MLNGTSRYLHRAPDPRRPARVAENHSSRTPCEAACLSQRLGTLAGTEPRTTWGLSQREPPDESTEGENRFQTGEPPGPAGHKTPCISTSQCPTWKGPAATVPCMTTGLPGHRGHVQEEPVRCGAGLARGGCLRRTFKSHTHGRQSTAKGCD